MKIIHAADLHLGRCLHERDLGPDQAVMLEALLAALVEHRADLLVLAGDIYDRAIPPPEAIALFDRFVTRAAQACPGLVIVAIPGNHDSAARLSFGAELLRREGLNIRSRPEEVAEPIIIEKDGERLSVWALPYLNPGSCLLPDPEPAPAAPASQAPGSPAQGELFGDEGAALSEAPSGLRSQAELFAEAMTLVKSRLDPESLNLLVAHCFAAGGSPSESERSFVGAAEEVPIGAFEGFDYVALGHLHRRQAAGPNARYPGSPLAYSFSEAEASPEKGFLLVELGRDGFAERPILFEPLHHVARISGSYEELSRPGAFPEFRGAFVEARLTDESPVIDPVDALRANFPNLLSVRQVAFEMLVAQAAGGQGREAGTQPPRPEGEAGEGLVLDDFRAFHGAVCGKEAEPELEALFSEILKEAANAPA